MSGDSVGVPLHLLHAWWTARQDAQREKILADVEVQASAFPPHEREAILAEARRLIQHRFDIQHAQIDRVIADEIERRL